MVKKRLFKLLVIFFTLALMLKVGGCTSEYKTYSFFHQNKPSPGYKTVYNTHFSFEYPRDYRVEHAYTNTYGPAPVEVGFIRRNISNRSTTDAVFGIHVYRPTLEKSSAKVAVENRISLLGNSSTLHEKSLITVNDIQAEIIVYTNPEMHRELPEAREIFFDYDDRIWHIFIYSKTNESEQAKTDFNHILETFKIIS